MTAPSDDELKDLVRHSLPGFNVPVAFTVVDELPRNPALKVSLPDVAALYEPRTNYPSAEQTPDAWYCPMRHPSFMVSAPRDCVGHSGEWRGSGSTGVLGPIGGTVGGVYAVHCQPPQGLGLPAARAMSRPR